MKTALVTGVTGQDGSYLADFLVEQGYKVYGLVRRTSSENLWRVHHLHDRIELIFGDLLDQNSLISAISDSKPDEVYNLAAQSLRAHILEPTCAHGRVHRTRRHTHARSRSRRQS